MKARLGRNTPEPLLFVLLCLLGQADLEAAVPLTTARIGAGPSQVQGPADKAVTWGAFGTFRLGAYQERLNLIAGIDLTAYRIHKALKSEISQDIDGNDVLFFLGYATGDWNLWGGVGAGQMRVYDREGEDRAVKPHRSISQATEAGASYDLYKAQYGKIDTSITWRRLRPEKAWRSTYALNMIDSLQFEFGFKLLGW